ncbi:MAG TPA: hypothetical protein PL193_07745 [Xanthobacteraceae bacterium]|nr:hypothetical protein [Xanthobacteraceae bacterium]
MTKADWKKQAIANRIDLANAQRKLDLAKAGLSEAAQLLHAAGMTKAARRFREAAVGEFEHFNIRRFDIPF